MLDWLKKTAQKAVQTASDLGAEYSANQTLIAELLVAMDSRVQCASGEHANPIIALAMVRAAKNHFVY